jgi:hypothetical protein
MKTLLVLISVLFATNTYAQKKAPRHGLGGNIAISSAGFQERYSEYPDSRRWGNNKNAVSLAAVYRYQPLSWLAVNSGLSFHQWGSNSPVGANNNYMRTHMYLGVPLIGELKPFSFLGIELGLQNNFQIYQGNDIRSSKPGWPGPDDPDGNVAEVSAVTGLRFHLYKGLSLGVRIYWGLTPVEEETFEYGAGLPPLPEIDYKAYNRVIEVGIQYVHPLK